MDNSTSHQRGPGPSGGHLGDKVYNSLEGRNLSRRIFTKYLPFDPHEYQLDGICPVMDGFDLLATTPCGSGKTGYLIMLMLVVCDISADLTWALIRKSFQRILLWWLFV
jgi:hypothetical protein